MARRQFRFTVAVLAGSLCCAVASVHAGKIGPEAIARFLADYAAMAIEFDHDYAFAELTPENSAQVAENLLSLATAESGVCEMRLRTGAWLALTAMVLATTVAWKSTRQPSLDTSGPAACSVLLERP